MDGGTPKNFRLACAGRAFARPNPRPMFPNPPGFSALSRTRVVLRIGSGGDLLSNATAAWPQSWE